MIKTIRTSILGLLVLPLAAQAPGFSVAGGPILGFESLKKATNNTVGYQLGTDFTGHVPTTEIPARVGLAIASFPGKELNGLKTSLTLAQLHGDLLLPLEGIHGYGIFGGSLNSYSMSTAGTESTDELDIDHHFPVRDAKGLKLGLRLGLGFNLSKRVGLELTFQQTELSGKDLNDPMVRVGGVNPGWLNLDLRFTF
jgi:hypothetical protein